MDNAQPATAAPASDTENTNFGAKMRQTIRWRLWMPVNTMEHTAHHVGFKIVGATTDCSARKKQLQQASEAAAPATASADVTNASPEMASSCARRRLQHRTAIKLQTK